MTHPTKAFSWPTTARAGPEQPVIVLTAASHIGHALACLVAGSSANVVVHSCRRCQQSGRLLPAYIALPEEVP
ncbi:hypothetical protein BZM26_10005 [Paraburkholderia strydomiana]|nr:hypothetical protein BZM26_10005 [Paraburkholderia strydomiana]